MALHRSPFSSSRRPQAGTTIAFHSFAGMSGRRSSRSLLKALLLCQIRAPRPDLAPITRVHTRLTRHGSIQRRVCYTRTSKSPSGVLRKYTPAPCLHPSSLHPSPSEPQRRTRGGGKPRWDPEPPVLGWRHEPFTRPSASDLTSPLESTDPRNWAVTDYHGSSRSILKPERSEQ